MDRRTFTRLSALSLAYTKIAAHAQTGSAAPKPVGFAVVGLGSISSIFMRACSTSQRAKITALVTGHPENKGAAYAAMYGIPKSSIYTYETFDRIRDNKEVEAVYIGLPNSMHCEYTQRAAQAGKHVLCEKPMAVSSSECRTMIDACRKAHVKLMIAYRIQYEPMWMETIRMVREGGIGQIESFQGGFYNQQGAGTWRLTKKLGGGGSLLDLGIYPLNAIRSIVREEPSGLTAVVSTLENAGRFTEVEESVEWTMKFPSGVIASCGCSYGQRGPAFLNMNGSDGFIEISPAFFYDGVHVRGSVAGRQIDQLSAAKAPYQFALEADHFADCIRRDTDVRTPGEEGLKDMLAIEAIYRAAGTPIA
jgi:predicted dehydrogenase